MNKKISAKAVLHGSAKYPDIKGYAVFVTTDKGTMVSISVYGLPEPGKPCEYGIFAMHIHENGDCTGDRTDPFANVKSHYDPQKCPHPYHSGDMPSLYAYGSQAHMAFITDRFTPEEVIGRAMVIHSGADDMHTQPSGNSGEKIACGKITKL